MTTAEIMSAPAVPLGPATPPHRLAELAENNGTAVRLRIVDHPNTDTETLVALSTDDNPTVRAAALQRLNR